jgi:hypothetical protein
MVKRANIYNIGQFNLNISENSFIEINPIIPLTEVDDIKKWYSMTQLTHNNVFELSH